MSVDEKQTVLASRNFNLITNSRHVRQGIIIKFFATKRKVNIALIGLTVI